MRSGFLHDGELPSGCRSWFHGWSCTGIVQLMVEMKPWCVLHITQWNVLLPLSTSCVVRWCRPARTAHPPSSITACCAAWSGSCCQSSCRVWTEKRWSNSAWTESTSHRRTEQWPHWDLCSPACTLVRKTVSNSACCLNNQHVLHEDWCFHYRCFDFLNSLQTHGGLALAGWPHMHKQLIVGNISWLVLADAVLALV